MSEIVEITIMTYGIELDLVVECDIEPGEEPSWDGPGCPGGIEVTGVWRDTVRHGDIRGRYKRDHAIRSGKRKDDDLLEHMTDEEAERIAELVENEFDSQAEDGEADYLMGLAEDAADARRDREMARWP